MQYMAHVWAQTFTNRTFCNKCCIPANLRGTSSHSRMFVKQIPVTAIRTFLDHADSWDAAYHRLIRVSQCERVDEHFKIARSNMSFFVSQILGQKLNHTRLVRREDNTGLMPYLFGHAIVQPAVGLTSSNTCVFALPSRSPIDRLATLYALSQDV